MQYVWYYPDARGAEFVGRPKRDQPHFDETTPPSVCLSGLTFWLGREGLDDDDD